jgi:hypothetical protein
LYSVVRALVTEGQNSTRAIMRRMPGRPLPSRRRDAERRAKRERRHPAGALAMLVAISGVFVYGIYLKAAGPSESAV